MIVIEELGCVHLKKKIVTPLFAKGLASDNLDQRSPWIARQH